MNQKAENAKQNRQRFEFGKLNSKNSNRRNQNFLDYMIENHSDGEVFSIDQLIGIAGTYAHCDRLIKELQESGNLTKTQDRPALYTFYY